MPAIEVEKFDGIVSITMPTPMVEQLVGILDTFIRRQAITANDSPESRQVQAAMDFYNELSRAGVL